MLNIARQKPKLINIRRVSIFVLLLILAILLGLIMSDQNPTDRDISSLVDDEQQYIAKKTQTLTYDAQGHLTHKLTADHVVNFPKSGQSELTFPILTLFTLSGAPEWQLSSNHAKINEKRQLTLIDNVLVKSLLPDAQVNSLITTRASINLNTHDIQSDEIVTIKGQGFHTVGEGLSGNIKAQIAKLLRNVTTIYEPKKVQLKE